MADPGRFERHSVLLMRLTVMNRCSQNETLLMLWTGPLRDAWKQHAIVSVPTARLPRARSTACHDGSTQCLEHLSPAKFWVRQSLMALGSRFEFRWAAIPLRRLVTHLRLLLLTCV